MAENGKMDTALLKRAKRYKPRKAMFMQRDIVNSVTMFDGFVPVRGTWTIASADADGDGIFEQYLDITAVGAGSNPLGLMLLPASEFSAANVELAGRVRASPAGRTMTMVARAVDTGGGAINGYGVWWRFTGTTINVEKYTAGVPSTIASTSSKSLTAGEEIRMRVENVATGVRIRVWIEGTLFIDYIDTSSPHTAAGRVGLGTDNAVALDYQPFSWREILYPDA